jgi:serine-type D-Ala-D-Ala carboxypeptidase
MSLPETAPERVGLDPKRLLVASRLVEAGREDGAYPAAVLLVARRGKIAHLSAHGEIGEGRPVNETTIFDLASLTKPLVALALLTLVEDGRVALSQTAQEYFPAVKATPLAPLTLRQLATHSSGLPAWKPLYKQSGREAIFAEIFSSAITHPPGTHYAYSDLGYILIGEIVRKAAGVPLDEYMHSRLFALVGMKDTGYRPGPSRRERIAPTANEPSRPGTTMRGDVHDGNAFALGGVAGHAGLFGTAPDLAIIATALLGNGQVAGQRVLGIPALRMVQTSQIPAEVGGHSIGWFTHPNGMLPRGDLFDDTTFGHTGFTGTMVVCNPTTGVVTILLTNRVVSDGNDATAVARVRRRVLNAVASAVIA